MLATQLFLPRRPVYQHTDNTISGRIRREDLQYYPDILQQETRSSNRYPDYHTGSGDSERCDQCCCGGGRGYRTGL